MWLVATALDSTGLKAPYLVLPRDIPDLTGYSGSPTEVPRGLQSLPESSQQGEKCSQSLGAFLFSASCQTNVPLWAQP